MHSSGTHKEWLLELKPCCLVRALDADSLCKPGD